MNEYRVYFSDTAKECLFYIAEYIALDNPVRAKIFVKELRDSIYNCLSIFPLSSPLYPGIKVDVRVYIYKKYNCYYRFIEATNTVEILYVYNAAKEVKTLLSVWELLQEQ